jgi:alpha-L-arabinofuranosidase
MKILKRQMTNIAAIIFLMGVNMACKQITKPTVIVNISNPGIEVAPICRGQELEEFNHGIEGGLYAQMINNPSFEEVVDAWGAAYPDKYWSTVVPGSSSGSISGQTSVNTTMLNSHQVHCIKLSVTSVGSGSVGLKNDGFWGMKLENNTTYKVSFWAKKGSNFSGTLTAKLESSIGTSYASCSFTPTSMWAHYTCDLVPSGIKSVSGNNRFVIYASTPGDVYFDVVTIMPPTWKDHGCRIDIAKKLDSLHLAFLAYPGGLDAHWSNYSYSRRWKESIGPVEQRGGSSSYTWGYKNDLYFGTDEFFQLAEDLGAEPMYVFTAGIMSFIRPDMPNRFTPLDSLHYIITDILDFLEYCNGSAATTWGAVRAANGRTAPYNLKYVQIGAENDMQLTEYNTRYPIIHDSIIAHYPDMKIAMCGNTIKSQGIAHPNGQSFWVVDCHALDNDNSDRYSYFDPANCDAGISKFMVQEYCSSHKGMAANVDADFGDALADAIYMLGCEKNSAHMWWTGYGNFGSIVGHGDFGCNLLWFDAVSCYGNPGYYMHKTLFGDNHGTQILPFTSSAIHAYFSTSVDNSAGKNDILIKVVNKTDSSESVNITLKGVSNVNYDGHYTMITAANDAANSLANLTNIHPEEGTFKARNSFTYTFLNRSLTVLRIRVLK